jgi:hypothetical protein
MLFTPERAASSKGGALVYARFMRRRNKEKTCGAA